MQVTVLGRYGPFPRYDGACSGYLVEHDNCKILLDCGSGVISRLQTLCNITQIDAIILTHLHSDHMSDILVLRYALDILMSKGQIDKRLPIYTPSQPSDEYNMLRHVKSFKVHDICNYKKIHIKGLDIYFEQMTHPYKSYAIKIQNSDSILVYSGDTSYNEKISSFAHAADLFICDSAFLENPKDKELPHLTVHQACKIASQANVKKLLLTHFWFQDDISQHYNIAHRLFPNAEIAQEMHTYNI